MPGCFVLLLFFFETPVGNSLIWEGYTDSFKLRFPMLYLAFFGIAFLLETLRALTQEKLFETQKQYAYFYLHDALTGVYNRYGFDARIRTLLAQPGEAQIALLILDIDHFKRVNDEFGHVNGDEVLRSVARLFERETAGQAAVCRWGGEEFAALFPDGTQAEAAAERVLAALRTHVVPLPDGRTASVTASIGGVIANRLDHADPDALLRQADTSLYHAKTGGRDRAIILPLRIEPKPAGADASEIPLVPESPHAAE